MHCVKVVFVVVVVVVFGLPLLIYRASTMK